MIWSSIDHGCCVLVFFEVITTPSCGVFEGPPGVTFTKDCRPYTAVPRQGVNAAVLQNGAVYPFAMWQLRVSAETLLTVNFPRVQL